MLLNKLDKLSDSDDIKIKILEQSIFYNWQGVYPLAENQQKVHEPVKKNQNQDYYSSGYKYETVEEKRRYQMESNKKIPPHSVEAEKTVLGSILLNSSNISIASKRIDVNTFYKEVHRIIFKSMLSIHVQGKPIDLIMLIEELKGNNLLEAVGVISYITSLQTIVPNSSNINYYIDLLIDKNNRRVAMSLLNDLNDKLFDEKIEVVKTGIESIRSIFTNNKSIEKQYCRLLIFNKER